MLLTTTNNVDGKTVRDYLGIVSGEAIMGANVVRDFFASVTDVIGGRSGAYESQLKKARELCLNEMENEASVLNADAIIGIDIDYDTVRDGMLMVTASGTAVRFER